MLGRFISLTILFDFAIAVQPIIFRWGMGSGVLSGIYIPTCLLSFRVVYLDKIDVSVGTICVYGTDIGL